MKRTRRRFTPAQLDCIRQDGRSRAAIARTWGISPFYVAWIQQGPSAPPSVLAGTGERRPAPMEDTR